MAIWKFFQGNRIFPVIDPGGTVALIKDRSKQIDHIEIIRINPSVIKLNQQLPTGIGYYSNHCAMFCDMAADGTLGIVPSNITNQSQRNHKQKQGNSRKV